MLRRLAVAFAAALVPTLAQVATPAASAGTACANLAALTIPNVTIKSAHADRGGSVHAAGRAGTPMTLPAFCRVEATARPTSDSDIKFEVWIPPAEAWNGKFQGVGNGGYQGSISYAAMATALRRGYATASTDTGHTGDDMKFGQGHPEKLIDYGLPRDPRDDRVVEADRPRRQRPLRRQVLFRRLLRRRTAGALRSAALSRGLRRHRRRRSGQQPDPPDLRVPAFVDRDARQGRQADHPAGQAGAADQGGRRGVRRDRRLEGRHHRRSAPLPLRSGQAAVQDGADEPTLPDRGTGRRGEEDLRRREEPADRRADLHRLAARQRRLRRGGGPELARRTSSIRPSRCASASSSTGCSTIRTGTTGRSTGNATSPTPSRSCRSWPRSTRI